MTREHSGGHRSQNNNLDPTLKEHEAEHGHSGEAITGDKNIGGQPDRQPARSDSPTS